VKWLVCLVVGLVVSSPAPAAAHPHGNWGSAYRSVDGGRIWIDLNRRDPVGTVYDVSAPRPPRVWEGTDRGLLRSDDLGETWRRVGPAAIGSSVRVVSEDPAHGSVLAGGSGGLFRAPADLSRWDRVLAAEPVALTRDGAAVLVRTAEGWFHSRDGGTTFAEGTGGLAAVNEQLAAAASASGVGGREVLATARIGDLRVAGTADGAYAARGSGSYRVVPGTEGLAVRVALASRDGVLLGTSRGLLRYRPGTPDPLVPEEDIPPFLAIGAVEVPAERPDELFIATSVRPYPEPPPVPVAAGPSGDVAPVLWVAGGCVLLVVTTGVMLALRRARR
jgi:hypothetical protein